MKLSTAHEEEVKPITGIFLGGFQRGERSIEKHTLDLTIAKLMYEV